MCVLIHYYLFCTAEHMCKLLWMWENLHNTSQSTERMHQNSKSIAMLAFIQKSEPEQLHIYIRLCPLLKLHGTLPLQLD